MMSGYLLNYYVNSVIVLAVRNLSTLAPEHDNADSSKAQYMLNTSGSISTSPNS